MPNHSEAGNGFYTVHKSDDEHQLLGIYPGGYDPSKGEKGKKLKRQSPIFTRERKGLSDSKMEETKGEKVSITTMETINGNFLLLAI